MSCLRGCGLKPHGSFTKCDEHSVDCVPEGVWSRLGSSAASRQPRPHLAGPLHEQHGQLEGEPGEIWRGQAVPQAQRPDHWGVCLGLYKALFFKLAQFLCIDAKRHQKLKQQQQNDCGNLDIVCATMCSESGYAKRQLYRHHACTAMTFVFATWYLCASSKQVMYYGVKVWNGQSQASLGPKQNVRGRDAAYSMHLVVETRKCLEWYCDT